MTISDPDTALVTVRTLSVQPRDVFAAFSDPVKLADWWGPAGFTNTFETFEFKPGGRWIYVMHGPDGRDYPNESVFREIEPDTRIVIDHVVLPLYTLTITMAPEAGKTLLTWEQEFENTAFVAAMRDFLSTANEQNLDRLEAVLAGSLA